MGQLLNEPAWMMRVPMQSLPQQTAPLYACEVAITLCWVVLVLWALPLSAQSRIGELHLKVTDPTGLGVRSSVELVSDANQYQQSFLTDDAGALAVKRLPFGVYQIEVIHEGLAPSSQPVEIRSAAPKKILVQLSFVPLSTTIEVKDGDTLIAPNALATSTRSAHRRLQIESTRCQAGRCRTW